MVVNGFAVEYNGFNIRSFGSWVASNVDKKKGHTEYKFQYPLFRIVGCFLALSRSVRALAWFQYPLFRIVGCFSASFAGARKGENEVALRLVCFWAFWCVQHWADRVADSVGKVRFSQSTLDFIPI